MTQPPPLQIRQNGLVFRGLLVKPCGNGKASKTSFLTSTTLEGNRQGIVLQIRALVAMFESKCLNLKGGQAFVVIFSPHLPVCTLSLLRHYFPNNRSRILMTSATLHALTDSTGDVWVEF